MKIANPILFPPTIHEHNTQVTPDTMANIRPIEATVWDLRIVAHVRRELEKSFNSMTVALDHATKTPSEEAQTELNSKSNSFCDLYEK